MINPFAVGQLIFLRPIEPEDAAVVAACNNDPDVRRTFFTHTPVSVSAQKGRLESLYAPGSDYLPFIISLKEDDTPIGVTAFHRVDLVSRAAVFSICISDTSKWGRGYARDASEVMLRYGFQVLNLHRVQLHVWTGNAAALKTYESLGFVKEGTLREAMCHDGEYCDFHVMGILENEWRAKHKA